jgi:polysaccharide pyruvyl transferase WcaK-like protein
VDIDTRLDQNRSGLRTSGEVEALISRMDLVLTTRLHGMVLAIKNGVPAVAVDAIAGGAKVTRQAESLGWPVCLAAENLQDADLQRAYEYCLTKEAREKARECAANAGEQLRQIRALFIADDNIRNGNP